MNVTLSTLTEALGWTLLHFLWQGTAIALVFWLVAGLAKNAKPALLHVAGCVAMAAMLFAACFTCALHLQPEANPTAHSTPLTGTGFMPAEGSMLETNAQESTAPALAIDTAPEELAPLATASEAQWQP